MASDFMGAQLGNLERAQLPWTLIYMLKVLWRRSACLSVSAVRREPGLRAHLLGTRKDMWKMFWRWACLSIGALFGEPGGGLVYRGL